MRKNAFNLTNRIVQVLKRPVADFYVAQGYSTTRNLEDPALFSSLYPWFVTGFIDGEGCFIINISRDNKYKLGWTVKARFSIGLHKKDLALLQQIQAYFCVGRIYIQGPQSFQFRVVSVKDLKVIVDHLEKYPLITQKRADYLLFKQALDLISINEHLTMEGLRKIVAIKGSMNLGLSDELKAVFPDITPMDRPLVKNQTIEDPNWLAGFTTGEGCFSVKISQSSSSLSGFKVQLIFIITQHSRDEQLMKSLVEYFGCGKYRERSNRLIGDFEISKFNDLTNKVIPFFDKYLLHGVKRLDYLDWCEVAKLMQNKEHLTQEGLSKISELKAGMNRGREFSGQK